MTEHDDRVKTEERVLADGTRMTVTTIELRPPTPKGQEGKRLLYQIAAEIRADWKKPYFGAVPYLEAMAELRYITDSYYADDAESIVLYFLSNANTWRGEVARRVKAELKGMAGIK